MNFVAWISVFLFYLDSFFIFEPIFSNIYRFFGMNFPFYSDLGAVSHYNDSFHNHQHHGHKRLNFHLSQSPEPCSTESAPLFESCEDFLDTMVVLFQPVAP
jgi:hypothetical protein